MHYLLQMMVNYLQKYYEIKCYHWFFRSIHRSFTCLDEGIVKTILSGQKLKKIYLCALIPKEKTHWVIYSPWTLTVVLETTKFALSQEVPVFYLQISWLWKRFVCGGDSRKRIPKVLELLLWESQAECL